MSGQERINPFPVDDLSDFGTTKTTDKKPNPEMVEEIASTTGFHSRQPVVTTTSTSARKDRRRRTGRSEQFNIKVSLKAKNKFYELQDRLDVTQGEAFERAVAALEAELDSK